MSLERDELELSSDLKQAAREMSHRFGDCPEPSLVLASEAGVLPAEVTARITRHLESCSLCKLMARDLEDVDAAPMLEPDRLKIWDHIQSRIPPGRAASRAERVTAGWWKSFLRPVPIAVTATAVILIGIAILVGLNLMRGARGPQQEAISNRVPERVHEQALPQPGSAPSTPTPSAATAFRLEKAPVRLPASAVMVWRGEANAESAQVKQLEEALAPYRADDYPGSEKRLQSLANKYPRLAEARFYLGVCQLFLDRYQEAVASLKTAGSLAKKPLAGDAGWYLAIAYHRSGQDIEARPLLEKLCRAGGKNAARACAALGELSASP